MSDRDLLHALTLPPLFEDAPHLQDNGGLVLAKTPYFSLIERGILRQEITLWNCSSKTITLQSIEQEKASKKQSTPPSPLILSPHQLPQKILPSQGFSLPALICRFNKEKLEEKHFFSVRTNLGIMRFPYIIQSTPPSDQCPRWEVWPRCLVRKKRYFFDEYNTHCQKLLLLSQYNQPMKFLLETTENEKKIYWKELTLQPFSFAVVDFPALQENVSALSISLPSEGISSQGQSLLPIFHLPE